MQGHRVTWYLGVYGLELVSSSLLPVHRQHPPTGPKSGPATNAVLCRLTRDASSSSHGQAGASACPGTLNLQPKFGSATTAGVRISSPAGFTPLATQFTRSAN